MRSHLIPVRLIAVVPPLGSLRQVLDRLLLDHHSELELVLVKAGDPRLGLVKLESLDTTT